MKSQVPQLIYFFTYTYFSNGFLLLLSFATKNSLIKCFNNVSDAKYFKLIITDK